MVYPPGMAQPYDPADDERDSTARPRSLLVPNANNPRLLLRLVRLVAGGIRRQRALAEALGVEVRTVHYYTQAGEWLGLLATDREVHLTRLGLDLVFSSPRRRPRVYAEAVWRNPFTRRLLQGRSTLPDTEAVAAFILQEEPEMSPVTARRRASAVRGLVEPAVGLAPANRGSAALQLSLPFPASFAEGGGEPEVRSPADLRAGIEDNPDLYARLLRLLLDHGELSLGHVRALLDRSGAADAPLGSYCEMAVRRGDARRLGDRLVATPGAVRRRDLAGDAVLIALSDPDYRAWLDVLAGGKPPAADPRAAARLSVRFAAWDGRLFGERPQGVALERALARLLPGRLLSGLPVAGAAGAEAPETDLAFVDVLDTPGLLLAFPSSLGALAGRVQAANELLAVAQTAPVGVRLPGPVDPRARVHGGLLHPGEAPPRGIPDNVSLRLRAMTHAPAFSLLAALLLLDRRPGAPVRVAIHEGIPAVSWRRARLGPLLDLFDRFCAAQGWVCARPPRGGLEDGALVEVAVALGIAARVDARVVLDEAAFLRLQEDPEGRLAFDGLVPLVDRLHAWLESGPAGRSAS